MTNPSTPLTAESTISKLALNANTAFGVSAPLYFATLISGIVMALLAADIQDSIPWALGAIVLWTALILVTHGHHLHSQGYRIEEPEEPTLFDRWIQSR